MISLYSKRRNSKWCEELKVADAFGMPDNDAPRDNPMDSIADVVATEFYTISCAMSIVFDHASWCF